MQSLTLAYDNGDRISKITNGISSALTQTLGYDAGSRLGTVTSTAENESYHYDADGNRISQVVNGTSTLGTVSATSNRLASFGSTSYGYDANGNTTTVAGTVTYHYDAFNRLASAGGMTYYVNPEGQRLRKSGSLGTSYFAPDRGGALLAEYSNGAWVDYVWLNGRLIGRVAGGQRYAVHTDQVGRPEAVTDSSKAVVWRAQNFAFNQNVVTASIAMNVGFPGQYYDAETGLWNNGFRDYSSVLGRYVESDPIGLGGGVNTYVYAGSNPVQLIDPLGLMAEINCVDKNVSITLNLSFQGPEASALNIKNVISAIESGWNGNIGEWNVTTTVNAVQFAPSAYNSINLVSGTVRSNAANWSVPGVWGDNTYRHEAGHVILGRTYGDGMGHDSLPNSIMTATGALDGRSVLPQQVQAAIDNVANNVTGCDCGK